MLCPLVRILSNVVYTHLHVYRPHASNACAHSGALLSYTHAPKLLISAFAAQRHYLRGWGLPLATGHWGTLGPPFIQVNGQWINGVNAEVIRSEPAEHHTSG